MAIELSPLPYDKAALEPVVSAETINFHYGKHHQTYVTKLNGLITGTKFEDMDLEEIVHNSDGSVFNNAAQIWNHAFYWNCLRGAKEKNAPQGKLAKAINRTFGSLDGLKEQFSSSAANNFGSGWTWLVKNAAGGLEIVNTSNAGTPLTTDSKPLLTVDVWEHAYYIDYRNARPSYLGAIWQVINWDFVARNFTD